MAASCKMMLVLRKEILIVASGVQYWPRTFSRYRAQRRALPSALYEKLVWINDRPVPVKESA